MIGTILQGKGKIIATPHLSIVHLHLEASQRVAPHDHVGHTVYFTPVQGQLRLTLNETEEHTLVPGTTLTIPGDASVSIEALAQSQAFIYLIANPQ